MKISENHHEKKIESFSISNFWKTSKNLIDEHFSTVSPQVFIPSNPFTSIRPTESYNVMHQELELLSVQVSEKTGEIFTRYKNKSTVQKSN